MRYKTLILILMSIICLACVEANIMCYQPMANISNCGNPPGGYYYIDAAYNNWTNNNSIRDGDFSTYSNASNVNYETAIMSRFLMPPYANNYSKTVWRKQSAGQFNITLSNNVSGIWSTKIGSYIQFTHYSMNLPVTPRMGVNTYMYVYNSSSYILYLVNESYTASLTTPANSHYYESGIWWNLSIEPIYPINGSTIQSPQVNVTYPIWDGNYFDYENISLYYDDNFKRKINKSTFSFCQQDSFTTSSNCGNSDNATCWIESGTSAWANGGAGTCGYDGGWGYANPSTGTAYEYQNITSNIYSQGIKNNSLITLSYYKYGGLESCGGTGYTYYLINKTINNTCFKSSMRFNITVMRPIVNGQTQGIYLQCLNSSAGWTTIYSDTWAAFSFCYISSIGYDGFSINWNLTNPIYNFTDYLFLSEGRHNISIEASNSTFTGNITNSTFFVDYSETINQTNGTETAYTPFYLIINKSTGLTTNTVFNLNGTVYSTSKTTGTDYDTYSANIYLPLVNRYWANLSYFWNYSVTNGTDYSYGITHGNISTRKVIAYECNNATYGNYPFINISYQDENTFNPININSTIYITGIRANESSTYSRDYNLNYTGWFNNSICMYPNTTMYFNYSVIYKGQSYPQRTYTALDQIMDSTTDLLTLYSLNSGDGLYARFRAMDVYTQPIYGVTITLYESVTGSLSGQESTDNSGMSTFFVNPDKTYYVIFYKVGYTTANLTVRPTSSDIYTYVMSSTFAENDSILTGIKYRFSPSMQTLNNNTFYNFTFNLSSTFWTVEQVWFQIWNTTTMIANITNTTASKYLEIQQNTSNYSVLKGIAIYSIGGSNYTVSQEWRVRQVFVGTGSVSNLMDDLENLGLDSFTKGILAIFFILTVLLSLNVKYNAMREVEPNLILINILVLFFSAVGWFELSTGFMGKYAVFMLIFIASLIIFMNKYRYGGG